MIGGAHRRWTAVRPSGSARPVQARECKRVTKVVRILAWATLFALSFSAAWAMDVGVTGVFSGSESSLQDHGAELSRLGTIALCGPDDSAGCVAVPRPTPTLDVSGHQGRS